MKLINVLSLLLFLAIVGCSNEKKPHEAPYYKRMADSEMQRYPESWMVDFSDKIKWNYTHGLEMQSFLQVAEKTGDEKYFNYAENYADTMINEDGSIETYRLERYNIDHINPGRSEERRVGKECRYRG